MVQERSFFVRGQPPFTIFDSLLGEGHVDQISVAVGFPAKSLAVQLNRSEILLRFFCRGRTETFVVLDGPAFTVVVDELPVFVFRQRVKYARLLALRRLDDGRDELQQETRNFQQRREVRVQKVD